MRACTSSLSIDTVRAPQFIDITDRVWEVVRDAQVQTGFVVVFSQHTTAAIKISENEPLLLHDMEEFLEKIAARDGYYQHNDFSVRTVNMTEDECPNGHAHCQHLILGSSETIPIVGGKMPFGPWQRLFLVELDRPRTREVVVQVLGL